MKKLMTIFGAMVLWAFFILGCGNGSQSPKEKAKIIKEYEDSLAMNEKAKQDSIANSDLKEKKIEGSPTNEHNLNFEHLYPFLKKSLLKEVCEPVGRIDETRNSLSVASKESEMFLSSWEWDLNNELLLIKDIDNDGLIDYTIELSNTGGGCGGNIGQSERWTLFGSKPDRFKCTHIIPYRSESGKWEKI